MLHSFVAGSTARLSDWAQGVGPVSSTATWFNFLASHDGIGLRATEGILDDDERAALVERTRAHGGRVSMAEPARRHAARSTSSTSATSTPCARREEAADPTTLAAKALAAHSILFAFLGVPAVYYHSLVGSPPDHEGMETSDINRRINREVLDADRLVRRAAPTTRAAGRSSPGCGTCSTYAASTRRFSPFGTQQVEHLDDRVFAVRRGAGTPDELLCVTNVTGETVTLPGVAGYDVLTDGVVGPLTLGPWGYAWLSPSAGPHTR